MQKPPFSFQQKMLYECKIYEKNCDKEIRKNIQEVGGECMLPEYTIVFISC